MFRRIHLFLAALAMLVAPIAMQSGAAMAAMPMDHHEMAQASHCGDGMGSQDGDTSTGEEQCCVAMCSAVAPLGTVVTDPLDYPELLRFNLPDTQHRSFLAKLPTPPPRTA